MKFRLQSLNDVVTNSDWRYPTTQVSIIPKNSDKKSDAAILNKINDLFCVEACYN